MSFGERKGDEKKINESKASSGRKFYMMLRRERRRERKKEREREREELRYTELDPRREEGHMKKDETGDRSE